MMETGYPWNQESSGSSNLQAKGLLGAGWRPLNRELDWNFLCHLAAHDGGELLRKTFDIASDFADALGRNQYAWWANILHVFSGNLQYEVDEFWNYITPEPPIPDYRYKDMLTVEVPVQQVISRHSIPVDYVLNRFKEITVRKILEFLGKPDLITQLYWDRYFYYPASQFVNWDRLVVLGTVYAYWAEHEVWLEIYPISGERGKRQYNLIATDLKPLVNKTTYNLAVMLSGYQSRVGQVKSQYAINAFPADIRAFTDTVQQAILDQPQLAVLVHGEPGTGKTAWTQAIAQEVLVPLGYVIFILDHDAVENFVPPNYLERVCIIINEADNLAQDRSSLAAQGNNKTEHILSLLDGTLYQSVVDEAGIKSQQRLVVLMTCNTTERLDPAVLRKGRVDLIYEFTHCFV